MSDPETPDPLVSTPLVHTPILKRPLAWFVAGAFDAIAFPLLVPWVLFAFGLIQGIRRYREIGTSRAAAGIAANAMGLIVYVAISVVLAMTKADPFAHLVTYLLVSPDELRLSTYFVVHSVSMPGG